MAYLFPEFSVYSAFYQTKTEVMFTTESSLFSVMVNERSGYIIITMNAVSQTHIPEKLAA